MLEKAGASIWALHVRPSGQPLMNPVIGAFLANGADTTSVNNGLDIVCTLFKVVPLEVGFVSLN